MPDANTNHTLRMEQRENLYITGVTELISFDEESIVVNTQLDVLVIRGSNLHVCKLNLENSELEVEGNICELCYEQQGKPLKNKSSSFWEKIFK
jgi:sporulation protein YabP